MKSKLFFLWLLVWISSIGYSQTVNDVLKKVSAQLSIGKPLQYKTQYTLFKDHDSKKVAEQYNGVFYKNPSNEVYIKINDTEIISTKKINLKINHGEKAIVLSDPMKNYFGEYDSKQLLQFCKVTSFKDLKSYWEISLEAKPYSGLPYSKIVVLVAKNFFVQKQIFFYNNAMNFSKDYRKSDVHFPRLEITYSDYQRIPVKATFFSSETYLSIGKKQVVLSPRLKKYELMDNRVTYQNIK